MAGPGGGPPRKSHTKSRNGCKTCKKRHIRCDETFPQCRNCTKHNCRCDYQDVAVTQTPPNSRRGPDLLMSPAIEMEIDNWHRSGIPPYPELMQCPRSGWTGLSRADLRLIHHIIGLSIDLHRRGLSACTVWAHKMPNFLAIALSKDFVMSAILGLSAFHLGCLTRDQETKQLAHHHKITALRGLQNALGSFSKENCDATLAASILLSWQTTDRPEWISLQHSISSVLDSMYPFWRQESELAQLVENQRSLHASDYSLVPEEDLTQLDQTIQALQIAQSRVSHNAEYSSRMLELIEFVKQFRKDYPSQTAEQSFERIQVLRQWLFWNPSSMLRGGDSEASALAVLAQFFAVGVVLDRFYPEMGASYLAASSVGPIEEIYRILATYNTTGTFNTELPLAMSLMDFPRHVVAHHHSLLAWSPRSSIEHYSPGPPSPYHGLTDYSITSPESASPSYMAYTPPLQSPPAVTVAGSPFQLADGYVTAASSHTLYPPSPQLLDNHDAQFGLSELGHVVSSSSAYTPPYGNPVLCGDLPRADASLGLNMDAYQQPHHFEMTGLVTPEPCWT
ncbi:hypothetical protein N7509_011026 [Penicillium cosmopolitanum]|uniref:Zn(2)-C6 fungal-type domain-containing protein n=1 Tax=Penicillium cosmopolitanum TaxID=1131564 RepID=A0A9W9VSN6_9EURO|nr:uncharacterized protein N7509_011026 [Penicillium cosmopolitanum]KAJ5388485.1 hypothetical protein N7509_011026 [Penicillium cosmopolitanum]